MNLQILAAVSPPVAASLFLRGRGGRLSLPFNRPAGFGRRLAGRRIVRSWLSHIDASPSGLTLCWSRFVVTEPPQIFDGMGRSWALQPSAIDHVTWTMPGYQTIHSFHPFIW